MRLRVITRERIRYRIFLYGIMFSFLQVAQAQNTIGLLAYEEGLTEGYTLFSPNSSKNTYLIDDCGYVINVWEGDGFPEVLSYLLEDGSLIYAGLTSLQKQNWEGEDLWLIDLENYGFHHHDIEPLPNGNVLLIILESFSVMEALEMGRNPNLIRSDFGVDAIYELKQTGLNSHELVWKWSFADHLIQDYDETKANYGVVKDHPHKLNINYSEFDNSSDWLHCNSIDYNADLDQIIISSRHTSEVYIIDHSTTTEEAKGSTGGRYGRGGDILWRWGNDQVFDAAKAEDQRFYQQHDASWIPAGFPDAGKLTVFNNLATIDFDGQEEYSKIGILDTEVLPDGNYELNTDGSFGPDEFSFEWTGTVLGNNFWSRFGSGVQMLPNGNFLTTLADEGKFVELTRNGEVVWVYQNPITKEPEQQGSIVNQSFHTFRAVKFTPDYLAFEGRNLERKGLIENENSLSEACSESLGIEEETRDVFVVFPNPTHETVNLVLDKAYQDFEVQVFNAQCQMIENLSSKNNKGSIHSFSLLQWPKGVYWVRLVTKDGFSLKKVLKF